MGGFLASAPGNSIWQSVTLTILDVLAALYGRYVASGGGRYLRRHIATVADQIRSQWYLASDMTMERRAALVRQSCAHVGWISMGIGVALATLAGGLVTFALTVSNATDSFDTIFSLFVIVALLLAMLLGATGGHFAALRWSATETPLDSAEVAQTSNSVLYYSSLVLWLLIGLFYGFVALLAYIVALQSPPVIFNALGTTHLWSAHALGIVEALLIVAIPLVALLCAQRIARSPLPRGDLGSDDGGAYARFLRWRSITFMLAVMMVCGWNLLQMIQGAIPYDSDTGLFGFVRNVAFGSTGALIQEFFWIGVMIFAFSGFMTGRLGGRLTGWWWQPRPTPQDRPAIGE